MKITATDRRKVNRCEVYFPTIGHAVQAVEKCLSPANLTLDADQAMTVREGHNRLRLLRNESEVDNALLIFELFRMPSGRYELNWYVS